MKSRDLRAPGGWSVECSPGGHFPTSWGLARLLGVWESKGGGDTETLSKSRSVVGSNIYV